MSRFFIKGRIRYEHSFRKTDTSQLSFITNAKDDSRKMIYKMNDKKKEKFMKKIISLLLLVTILFSLIGCSSKKGTITIAVPNDSTNEARALLLLESNGIIKLKEDATITATINDIVENPYGIEFKEIEAAQLPNYLRDVDYAIINSNYAISAGLNPITDSILIEGGGSYYANILAVKDGNQENPLVLELLAALNSRQVKDFIDKKYQGSVVSTVENLTDGYDASIDYSALENQTITVACSPTPHGEILNIAKDILASKNITLDIKEYNDYIIPNTVVEDGTILANYFQHLPYLEDFNKNNNTHIVSVGAIHVEPMGLYGGKQTGLDKIYDQNK